MREDIIDKALLKAEAEEAENLRRHLMFSGDTILDGLRALNDLSGDTRTLFVIDGEGKLSGSITDGDIRRALITGSPLQRQLGEVCLRDCLRANGESELFEAVSKAREKGIKLLPVLREGFIRSLFDLRKRKGLIAATGVLMAGGAGERMRPLTATVPKPLLEVGGKAIIDYNIDLLKAYGVKNIYITVNYLKEKIEEHVKELANTGIKGLECVAEPRRLGTMGSLTLLPKIETETVVVMNSDLLTDINLEKMYRRHIESEAMMTIAVTPYTVSVPFAILDNTEGLVTAINEKPTYNYFANAGIYMLKREIIDSLEPSKPLDAPELAERLIAKGAKVVQFVIDGNWIDIGSPDDYRQACDLMHNA